jgi:hypothetical protein
VKNGLDEAHAIARARVLTAVRRAAILGIGLLVLAFSWLLRFNDPGGSFAGLTDDHFFYLVRAWQILFGDLPVRDFVDHGAPLYYYVGAFVQQWFGRGTLSEVTFAVSVLSVAAALTFWLAVRASGSILCGCAAALVHILLEPRLYNYPKILVYVLAIPLLWRFADRPGPWTRFWLAGVTALGFLFRHDHGAFVGVAFAALLLTLGGLQWRDRLRHGVMYAALVLALLAPYFAFIEMNGGLGMYFRDALAWSARDRERAPLVWPGLFDETKQMAEASGATPLPARAVEIVRDNSVAWMFYVEIALPVLAIGVLALSRDGFRPAWSRAIPKLACVAVLGLALNAGFLRHPLAARLADPSVPHAILLAWLIAAAFRAAASGRSLRAALGTWAVPARILVVAVAIVCTFVVWAALSGNMFRRFEKAGLAGPAAQPLERVGRIRNQLREEWLLASSQHREDQSPLINVSAYLSACTKPDDRVFVQHYAPQVVALARRAFAGGHADLRPGFFNTQEAQRLTLERLRHQRVPVVLLETGEAYLGFRDSFPLIAAYFDEHYSLAGSRVFDERFGVQLFVRKERHPTGTYEPLGWPCFS